MTIKQAHAAYVKVLEIEANLAHLEKNIYEDKPAWALAVVESIRASVEKLKEIIQAGSTLT